MKIEKELTSALKSGSIDKIKVAFEDIYLAYFKLGFFISRQYLDEQNAQDVADEVFVSFFDRILKERKCDIDNIKQYLCRAIEYASKKELRRIKNIIPFHDNIVSTDFEKNDLEESLLEELDELEQRIISEHIILGKTFKEISQELNKPINTTKSIYRRGCQKAKRRLTWAKIK